MEFALAGISRGGNTVKHRIDLAGANCCGSSELSADCADYTD